MNLLLERLIYIYTYYMVVMQLDTETDVWNEALEDVNKVRT